MMYYYMGLLSRKYFPVMNLMASQSLGSQNLMFYALPTEFRGLGLGLDPNPNPNLVAL